MEHRIQSSRRSGEQWHLKCSCGWFITSHRYICEEAFQDHATPEPQIEEPRLKWWDDASYIRYQTDCGPCDGNNWWEYTMEDMIALANPPMLLHDEWGHPYWHTPKLLPSPCEATLLRAEADRQDQAAEESFQRCDTDGFLSQWALGLGAQRDRLQADILEDGGVAEFPALFDLQGNRVRAKLITVPDKFNYGRPKRVWAFCDLQDKLTGKFINPFPKRASTMEKKGYREGTETAPAKADIVGYGRGLSGHAWVATVRTDKGYPDTACIENPYKCLDCRAEFNAPQNIDPREEAYAGRTYEAPVIYCPHCGSDLTAPKAVADQAIERARLNPCFP